MSTNGMPPDSPFVAHVPYCEKRLDSLSFRVVMVCSSLFVSSIATNETYLLTYEAFENVKVGVLGLTSVREDCMYSSPLKFPKWESATMRLQRAEGAEIAAYVEHLRLAVKGQERRDALGGRRWRYR
jgi:hypothetical protein